jgi:hypothetical protein
LWQPQGRLTDFSHCLADHRHQISSNLRIIQGHNSSRYPSGLSLGAPSHPLSRSVCWRPPPSSRTRSSPRYSRRHPPEAIANKQVPPCSNTPIFMQQSSRLSHMAGVSQLASPLLCAVHIAFRSRGVHPPPRVWFALRSVVPRLFPPVDRHRTQDWPCKEAWAILTNRVANRTGTGTGAGACRLISVWQNCRRLAARLGQPQAPRGIQDALVYWRYSKAPIIGVRLLGFCTVCLSQGLTLHVRSKTCWT